MEKNLLNNLAKLRQYNLFNQDKYIYTTIDNKKIRFFYIPSNEKLDMNQFYKIYEILSNETPDIQHIVFIYTTATIQMKKLKLYKDILKIELFSENELKRLITGNKFIPIHRKVHKDVEDQIFKKFGKDSLPKIVITDPIVRLYDFELDSVVEIERPNGIYYRLVVPEDSNRVL